MKKLTINQLKSVFRTVLRRNLNTTQWNINQQVVEGNETRFLKKEYMKFKPKKKENKMNEFEQYVESLI